jgi:hypothetical protein
MLSFRLCEQIDKAPDTTIDVRSGSQICSCSFNSLSSISINVQVRECKIRNSNKERASVSIYRNTKPLKFIKVWDSWLAWGDGQSGVRTCARVARK